jgi:hypothetical protein
LHQAKIIEAKDMVGMLVREQDGMHEGDSLAKQLFAQVGRSVDQQVTVGQTHYRATPRAAIVGMIALAYLAAATNHGDADASARAQQDHLAPNVSGGKLSGHDPKIWLVRGGSASNPQFNGLIWLAGPLEPAFGKPYLAIISEFTTAELPPDMGSTQLDQPLA